MMNYIRSECYRIKVSKGIWIAIGILSSIVLAMNVVLALSGRSIPDFQYDTVRFSLNTFTAQIYNVVIFGAVVPGCMFMEDRKNGIFKNAVAYGISREKIFIGKCIVAFFYAFLVMCAVFAIYVGSAFALLREPEWLPLRQMITGIAASLPSATASMICTLIFGILCRSELVASLLWMVVYYIGPTIISIIGMKVELFEKLAGWLPYGFLRNEVVVTYSEYSCLWDVPQGFARCMAAGFLGIAIFLAAGVWTSRKLEV